MYFINVCVLHQLTNFLLGWFPFRAIVFMYNLPNHSSNASVRMTEAVLVSIYNGSIQFWNDSAITDVNPELTFPYKRIFPLARQSKSGSTKVVTMAFSAFSTAWNNSYHVFDKKDGWPDNVIKWYGPASSKQLTLSHGFFQGNAIRVS